MLGQIGIQLLLQIVLPAVLLADLFRKRPRNRLDWLLQAGVVGLTLLFAILVARWDWSSYYLRVLVPVLFLGTSVMAYRRTSSGPSHSTKPLWPGYVINSVLIAVLLWLNLSALRGLVNRETAVDLVFPLRGGVYYVGGGGTSRWLNNHSAFPPQDYALDIVKLNVLGNRALGVWPDDPGRYTVYGEEVHSPCSGTIAEVVDQLPDQRPPNRDGNHLAGNHVVVACQGVEVLLAHLMQDSVRVHHGQSVQAGEVVGRVGNSGNTTQPHLHIHAERGGPPGDILNGEGVPITFRGRFLVRNSLMIEP